MGKRPDRCMPCFCQRGGTSSGSLTITWPCNICDRCRTNACDHGHTCRGPRACSKCVRPLALPTRASVYTAVCVGSIAGKPSSSHMTPTVVTPRGWLGHPLGVTVGLDHKLTTSALTGQLRHFGPNGTV